MSVDPLTLYKLMTLYMLNKVNFPLTNAQLSGERIYDLYRIPAGAGRAGGNTADII